LVLVLVLVLGNPWKRDLTWKQAKKERGGYSMRRGAFAWAVDVGVRAGTRG